MMLLSGQKFSNGNDNGNGNGNGNDNAGGYSGLLRCRSEEALEGTCMMTQLTCAELFTPRPHSIDSQACQARQASIVSLREKSHADCRRDLEAAGKGGSGPVAASGRAGYPGTELQILLFSILDETGVQ